MENKYKYMDYIQAVISRMATNSFYLKGWSITIIAAITALSINESDWKVYGCSLFLTIIFWFLDAYYLKQEKLFRELYDKVRNEKEDEKIDFSLDISQFKRKVKKIPSIMFWSFSITPFYSSIVVVLLILIYIV